MPRLALPLCAATLASAIALFGQDDTVVFRSDVSLVRVDVQVLDRGGRTITGLRQDDFVLREQGKVREIRNFASEEMPMDVLLLVDVSGSMRVNVERLASAAQQAFQALGREDRIGLMVFDRRARTRLHFRPRTSAEAMHALDRLLAEENFRGGTDVTTGIYSAIEYVRKNSRRDARKAIVIMTDDQTEFQSDVPGLVRALHRDDIVLSLLLAPDGMAGMRRYPTGGYPTGGGGTGRRRPGLGSSWPDIIWGPRFPGGGGTRTGGGGGPVIITGRGTSSAGTDRVAEQSGGDHMSVDQASALEDTLLRLRQRYALHFNLPDGVREGQQRDIQITLAASARNRYPDADLRYRRNYTSRDSNSSTPAEVTQDAAPPAPPSPAADEESPARRAPRRPRVSDPGSGATAGPMIDRDPNAAAAAGSTTAPANTGGWRRNDSSAPPPPPPAPAKPGDKPKTGGWPRANQ